MIETDWTKVPDGSDLCGKTIGDLGIRSEIGVSVVAVIRGDEVIPNPGPDIELNAGDVIGTLGTTGQRDSFREFVDAGQLAP